MLGIGLVYKTSFDKANRTSAKSNRGLGLDGALPIFAEIRQALGRQYRTTFDQDQVQPHPQRWKAVSPGHRISHCRPTHHQASRG